MGLLCLFVFCALSSQIIQGRPISMILHVTGNIDNLEESTVIDSEVLYFIAVLEMPADRYANDLRIVPETIVLTAPNADETINWDTIHTKLLLSPGSKTPPIGYCKDIPGCDEFAVNTNWVLSLFPPDTATINFQCNASITSRITKAGQQTSPPENLYGRTIFTVGNRWRTRTMADPAIVILSVLLLLFLFGVCMFALFSSFAESYTTPSASVFETDQVYRVKVLK
jgi:hypothetical protein